MARRRRIAKKKDKEVLNSGKIKHKRTEIDGIVFASKMESDYYVYLKDLKAKGLIKNFEIQVPFELQEGFMKVDGRIIVKSDKEFNKIKKATKAPTILAIKYISDFVIENNDGTIRVVDTKGQSTPDFEIKRKMFELKYPQYHLEVLIWDKQKSDWVDYYNYQKEKKARKKKIA